MKRILIFRRFYVFFIFLFTVIPFQKSHSENLKLKEKKFVCIYQGSEKCVQETHKCFNLIEPGNYDKGLICFNLHLKCLNITYDICNKAF